MNISLEKLNEIFAAAVKKMEFLQEPSNLIRYLNDIRKTKSDAKNLTNQQIYELISVVIKDRRPDDENYSKVKALCPLC